MFDTLAVRVLTVLAAAFFVLAFSLALLLSPDTSLAEMLAVIDHRVLAGVQGVVRARVSDWAWAQMVYPLLVRPCWLLPAAAGLVVGGAAVTLANRRGAPRSRRRRS